MIYGMTRGFILIGYCGFPRGYHPWNDSALDGTVPTLVCDGRKFVTDRAWRGQPGGDQMTMMKSVEVLQDCGSDKGMFTVWYQSAAESYKAAAATELYGSSCQEHHPSLRERNTSGH